MPQSKRKFPALLCIEYFNSSSEFVFARYPVRNLYLRGILFEIWAANKIFMNWYFSNMSFVRLPYYRHIQPCLIFRNISGLYGLYNDIKGMLLVLYSLFYSQ